MMGTLGPPGVGSDQSADPQRVVDQEAHLGSRGNDRWLPGYQAMRGSPQCFHRSRT